MSHARFSFWDFVNEPVTNHKQAFKYHKDQSLPSWAVKGEPFLNNQETRRKKYLSRWSNSFFSVFKTCKGKYTKHASRWKTQFSGITEVKNEAFKKKKGWIDRKDPQRSSGGRPGGVCTDCRAFEFDRRTRRGRSLIGDLGSGGFRSVFIFDIVQPPISHTHTHTQTQRERKSGFLSEKITAGEQEEVELMRRSAFGSLTIQIVGPAFL